MSRKSKPRPRLIVISAPSGAGKTTLVRMLLEEFPDEITRSISTTTRPRRPREKDGVSYHFVDPAEFQRRIDRGDFAEWAEVHGNRYGTTRATIDEALKAGRHVVFDIDYQGAMSLRRQYGSQALLVFILPPSMEILEQRLRDRASDAPATIATRLRNAYNELEWSRRFDYQITNDDLTRAYGTLREIYLKECR